MNPLEFPILADENINNDVIRFLREKGGNVQSVLLEFIAQQQLAVRPPFIVVAARTKQTIRVRVRQL